MKTPFYAHSPSLNQLVTSVEFRSTALTLPDWIGDLNAAEFRGAADWTAQATPEQGGIRLA